MNFIEEFANDLLYRENLAKNTLSAYSQYILLFSAFTKNTKFKWKDEVNFLNFLASKYSSNSQKVILSAIRKYFDFLVSAGIAKKTPFTGVKCPKIKLKPIVTLSSNEVRKMLNHCEIKGDRKLFILISLMYFCGLRVSEAINVKKEDLQSNFLLVNGKGTKTREVFVNRKIKFLINNYPKNQLFLDANHKLVSRTAVFYAIKNIATKSGIKKHVTPHTFRHSFATNLIHQGINIHLLSKLMGHASIQTTERYIHLKMDKYYKKFASVLESI